MASLLPSIPFALSHFSSESLFTYPSPPPSWVRIQVGWKAAPILPLTGHRGQVKREASLGQGLRPFPPTRGKVGMGGAWGPPPHLNPPPPGGRSSQKLVTPRFVAYPGAYALTGEGMSAVRGRVGRDLTRVPRQMSQDRPTGRGAERFSLDQSAPFAYAAGIPAARAA
jgi:hypothetical protein